MSVFSELEKQALDAQLKAQDELRQVKKKLNRHWAKYGGAGFVIGCCVGFFLALFGSALLS